MLNPARELYYLVEASNPNESAQKQCQVESRNEKMMMGRACGLLAMIEIFVGYGIYRAFNQAVADRQADINGCNINNQTITANPKSCSEEFKYDAALGCIAVLNFIALGVLLGVGIRKIIKRDDSNRQNQMSNLDKA
ncbi:MAG: hypothetical protein JHC93_06795 [Parachlamydiales bacterium]|nr:hypothetical protein [Parachlamydiales bacterium]